jgi:hypothetical protein
MLSVSLVDLLMIVWSGIWHGFTLTSCLERTVAASMGSWRLLAVHRSLRKVERGDYLSVFQY